jgi:uncharacterized membrane protein
METAVLPVKLILAGYNHMGKAKHYIAVTVLVIVTTVVLRFFHSRPTVPAARRRQRAGSAH